MAQFEFLTIKPTANAASCRAGVEYFTGRKNMEQPVRQYSGVGMQTEHRRARSTRARQHRQHFGFTQQLGPADISRDEHVGMRLGRTAEARKERGIAKALDPNSGTL
ncbi:MAG TPA: hypothetical protein EYG46_10225 [Myxococcales bacterium]|nr:hypothetical protein [Myxococcales bacterium]HIM01356.1 hypothetical protein [Myxococcales bacterium]